MTVQPDSKTESKSEKGRIDDPVTIMSFAEPWPIAHTEIDSAPQILPLAAFTMRSRQASLLSFGRRRRVFRVPCFVRLSSSSPSSHGIAPPLKHIRILDLTRVLAGPTCTMLLADLGADVIKVESTSGGDDTSECSAFISFTQIRHLLSSSTGSWYPPSAPLSQNAPKESVDLPPESAYFLAVNRNKRSITVNFKTPEGLEILHRLVAKVDVLVENFIPGRLSRLGLGWEDCRKLNPGLVYASISGTWDILLQQDTICRNSYRQIRLWTRRTL